MNVLRSAPLVAAVLFFTSCNIITEACTLIGCVSQVQVVLTGRDPARAYTVDIISDAGSSTFTCAAGAANCSGSLQATPGEVTVRIRTATQTTEQVHRPSYQVSYPNGRDCPPECRQATLAIAA